MSDRPPVEGGEQFRAPFPLADEGSPLLARREAEPLAIPPTQTPATDQHAAAAKIAKYGTITTAISAVAAIILAATTGLFGLLKPSEAKPAQEPTQVVSCAAEQQSVIDLTRRNPGYPFSYSGPTEEQCHLNDLVKGAPKPSNAGEGAPGG